MPVPVALLALLSSLLWGTSDFLGGTAAKRLPSVLVVGASQSIALLALLPVSVLLGSRPEQLWAAVVAGAVGLVALGAFYAALAVGTMGVVAPVASLGALLPVAIGLARGESPSVLQVVGIGLAIAGVVLASGPELSGQRSARPLLLAGVAAVGFGLVAVLLAQGSKGGSGAVLTTLVVMRLTSVGLMGLVLAATRRRRRRRRRRTCRTSLAGADLPLLAAIGLGDVGANACFAVASRSGLLSVVSVLASLYPVVTVVLARHVHAERLRPVQVAGAIGTLTGVALLAAG